MNFFDPVSMSKLAGSRRDQTMIFLSTHAQDRGDPRGKFGRSLRAGQSLAASAAIFMIVGVNASWAGHDSLDRGKLLHDGAVKLDFDRSPPTKHHLGGHVTAGIEFEFQYDVEGNYDLDDAALGSEHAIPLDATIFVSHDPTTWFQSYLEVELAREYLVRNPENKRLETQLKIKEVYVALRDPKSGLTFLAGRQDIEDDREWVIDSELDGIRLAYRTGPLAIDGSVTREELFIKDLLDTKNDRRINNYYLRGYANLDANTKVGLYTFIRDNLNAGGEDLLFLGAQASGTIYTNLDLWLETAIVTGRTSGRDIVGFGFDVGGSYIWKMHPMRPSAVLGFAFGTGDDGQGTDNAFRQTGVQDNTDRYGGLTSFQYYGEVLNPELSNLGIVTAGAGIRPTKRISVDLFYHRYFQHRSQNSLRNVDIDGTPEGTRRSIGDEIDLIIGIEEIKDVKIEIIGGVFLPGNAFNSAADAAYFGKVEIKAVF